MTLTFGWETLAAAVAVLGAAGAVIMQLIRGALRREFVTVAAHEELSVGHGKLDARVSDVERRIEAMPTRQDVKDLTNRLSAVEAGISGVSASVRGIDSNLTQLAHDVRLLIENGLREAKP